MPKKHIVKQSSDIIFLRNFYKKLIKLIIILYAILAIWLFKIINYNLLLTKNDYFVVTTFGKLIQLFPLAKK